MIVSIYFNATIVRTVFSHKILNERHNNCNDWTEFIAFMKTKIILNGLAFIDEMKTDYFGKELTELGIRMVDPKTNNWTIYWVETANPVSKIIEQVTDTFKNGIGEFHGKKL